MPKPLSASILALAGLVTFLIVSDRWRGPVDSQRLIGRILGEATLPPSEATFLLVTSPDCPYCQASIPFYQKLGSVAASSGGRLSLRAIVPVPPMDARQYLDVHSLLWSLSALDARRLGIVATPTLMLLDGDNRVRRIWVGLLDKHQRTDVMIEMQRLCPECMSNSE